MYSDKVTYGSQKCARKKFLFRGKEIFFGRNVERRRELLYCAERKMTEEEEVILQDCSVDYKSYNAESSKV